MNPRTYLTVGYCIYVILILDQCTISSMYTIISVWKGVTHIESLVIIVTWLITYPRLLLQQRVCVSVCCIVVSLLGWDSISSEGFYSDGEIHTVRLRSALVRNGIRFRKVVWSNGWFLGYLGDSSNEQTIWDRSDSSPRSICKTMEIAMCWHKIKGLTQWVE